MLQIFQFIENWSCFLEGGEKPAPITGNFCDIEPGYMGLQSEDSETETETDDIDDI